MWLRSPLGLVLLFGVVSLALFSAGGGPFGALNHWSIGASGVLAVAFVLAVQASDLGRSSVGGVVLSALAVFGATEYRRRWSCIPDS